MGSWVPCKKALGISTLLPFPIVCSPSEALCSWEGRLAAAAVVVVVVVVVVVN